MTKTFSERDDVTRGIMNRRTIVIALVALLAFFGCSEDTDNSGSSGEFAGTWSGTYTSASSDSGTWTLTVTSDGSISGSGVSDLDGDFVLTGGTGSVGNDGTWRVGVPMTARIFQGTFTGDMTSGIWVYSDEGPPTPEGTLTGSRS